MDADRWSELEKLFHQAVDLTTAERRDLLAAQRAADPELSDLLAELLAAAAESPSGWDGLDLGPPAGSQPAPLPEVPGYSDLVLEGHGGMASVYRGRREEQLFAGQQVAIKVLHAHRLDPYGRRRFAVERRLLASLDHPYIVRLLDGGELADGRPFLVMEYVSGQPLDVYCRQHRLAITDRLRLIQQLCRALQHAHQNLVVHRDLKPSNVLVDQGGNLRLLDFGIAKLLGDDVTATASYLVPMTPAFASPEQLAGQTVTVASDIYSAGLLLFLLLTGEVPRATADDRDPPRPSSLVAGKATVAAERQSSSKQIVRRLRGDLDQIASKALRWEPGRRFASAQALADDLERHLQDRPIRARRGSKRYRAQRFVKRHRVVLSVVGLALASLILAIAAGIQSWRLAEQGQETLTLIEQLAEPAEERLMPSGRLAEAITGIQRLDQPLESKLVLLNLVSQLNLPEEQLLQRSLDLFGGHLTEAANGRSEAELGLLIGEMMFAAGHYESAEKMIAAARGAAEGSFDRQDVELSRFLESHGRALAELELYAEATEALERGRLLLSQGSGDFSERAKLEIQLSTLYYLWARFDRAVEAARRALRLVERVPDADPGLRASILKALAVALIEVEPSDPAGEAEASAREGLRLNQKHFGRGHLETIHARHNLATVLVRSRGPAVAIPLAEENLALAEAELGSDHPRISYLALGLASGYQDVGRPADCIPLAQRAFELRAASLPAGNWLTAVSRLRLGSCLAEIGRTTEARRHLEAALWDLERTAVEDDHFLQQARRELSALPST
ncbi:MAG: serine/threonine-protein kinase [Acidobacteriota bacterium]